MAMLLTAPTLGETVWGLPPLILHPFSERTPPETLLENSRAALILTGLLPDEGEDREVLSRKLLAGRYAEIRMLFFLGKDLFRWIGQCMEVIEKEEELRDADLRQQSFAGILSRPPENVRDKLLKWGVVDYAAVFARALGLNALFAEPPAFACLTEQFIRNYHRTSDLLYQAFMESEAHRMATFKNFTFDLYASGEYSKMLENEWGEESNG